MPRRRRRAAGFTLVEILVVLAILALLLGIVFRGGSALIRNAKTRDTEALLKKLDLAFDEYRREVDTSRIPGAKNVFNGAPPDDLRVFVGDPNANVTVGGCPLRMRNTGKILLNGNPVANLDALQDDRDSSGRLINSDHLMNSDIRALVLAIRLNAPKARTILDSIDGKYWADTAAANDTLAFEPAPNEKPIPLDYLVDSWGNPLEYFSTCICDPTKPLTPREWVSNAFVHENNDGPLVVSYGANGTDQFAQDMLRSPEGDTSMIADYFAEMKEDPTKVKGIINHPFNNDNVYSSDFFTNRVRQTAP